MALPAACVRRSPARAGRRPARRLQSCRSTPGPSGWSNSPHSDPNSPARSRAEWTSRCRSPAGCSPRRPGRHQRCSAEHPGRIDDRPARGDSPPSQTALAFRYRSPDALRFTVWSKMIVGAVRKNVDGHTVGARRQVDGVDDHDHGIGLDLDRREDQVVGDVLRVQVLTTDGLRVVPDVDHRRVDEQDAAADPAKGRGDHDLAIADRMEDTGGGIDRRDGGVARGPGDRGRRSAVDASAYVPVARKWRPVAASSSAGVTSILTSVDVGRAGASDDAVGVEGARPAAASATWTGSSDARISARATPAATRARRRRGRAGRRATTGPAVTDTAHSSAGLSRRVLARTEWVERRGRGERATPRGCPPTGRGRYCKSVFGDKGHRQRWCAPAPSRLGRRRRSDGSVSGQSTTCRPNRRDFGRSGPRKASRYRDEVQETRPPIPVSKPAWAVGCDVRDPAIAALVLVSSGGRPSGRPGRR